MKKFFKFSLLTLCIGLVGQPVNAQVMVKKQVAGGEGIFHLKELQAILTSKNDTIQVLTVLPKTMRPAGYADVDIQANDTILMLNAKRVKKIKAFEEIYNGLEVGQTVKMGIHRNGELFIKSFEKIDPADVPQNQNIQIKTGGHEEGKEGGGMLITKTITMGAGENMQPWMGTGLMLGFEDNKVKVMQVMDGMTDALGNADIKQDDEIASLNGQIIESLEKFFEIYEKLAVGSKVELAYFRNDKKMQAAFTKPETKGRMIIKHN